MTGCSFSESVVEDATLGWLEGVGYNAILVFGRFIF